MLSLIRRQTCRYVSTFSFRAATALAALALAAAGVRAQPSPQPDAWALDDGVLVTPRGGLVYLMTPEGGIDAVDAAAGTVAWRTSEAAKPLALAGDLLVAQGESGPDGRLELVVLDTRRPGSALSQTAVALPEEVRAHVDDGLGERFRALATIRQGEVLVSWKAERRPRSGVSPNVPDPTVAPLVDGGGVKTAAPRAAAIRRFEGAALVDLATGRVQTAAPTKAAAGPGLRELTGAERLAGVEGRQFLSVDGRHVLASERAAAGEAGSRYRWTLYARAGGERLGGIDSRVSATPFWVNETIVLFLTGPRRQLREDLWLEEPPSIRAVDVATGVELWSREVRDTKYRGPLPP